MSLLPIEYIFIVVFYNAQHLRIYLLSVINNNKYENKTILTSLFVFLTVKNKILSEKVSQGGACLNISDNLYTQKRIIRCFTDTCLPFSLFFICSIHCVLCKLNVYHSNLETSQLPDVNLREILQLFRKDYQTLCFLVLNTVIIQILKLQSFVL